MELKTYFAIFWRRKWVIVFLTILTTLIAVTVSLLTEPTYRASTTIRVATIGGGTANFGNTDISYSQLLMQTYVAILGSGSLGVEVQNQLELEKYPSISAELIPSTELMRINAEATDPIVARDIANVAAQVLISKSRELYSGGGETTQDILAKQLSQIEEELNQVRSDYEQLLAESPGDGSRLTALSQSIALKERTYGTLLEQYEYARVNEVLRANAVSIVDYAYAPGQPSKPRTELNLVLGVLVGLVGGAGLSLVLENFDTTLYSTKQIEAVSELPTIGKIPSLKEPMGVIHFENGYQPQLEAFRRLRTNILASDAATAIPHLLLVTSAERGEGKSTIAANLAVTIAQSGRRVVLVDGDMRRPTLHQVMEHPNKRGLSDVLLGNIPLTEAIQESTFSRLFLLTSGPLMPNPPELLGSKRMASIFDKLKEEFDIIIIDTPALLSVTDAAVLVPYADTVVLVVAVLHSRRESILAVRQELSYVNVRSVGVVINRAESNGRHVY